MATLTITAQDRSDIYWNNVCAVFSKVDRVLTNQAITVTTEQSMIPAPSWVSGQTITFNRQVIDQVLSADNIVKLTGLNYHELAHVLYTPPVTSWLAIMLRGSSNLFPFYNVLEDQRIETLLTGKFPSTIPYLTNTVLDFIVQHPDTELSSVFPLVHGRRYLPVDLRRGMRQRFADQKVAGRIADIIDEYRFLAIPVSPSAKPTSQHALDLIEEFAKLLSQAPADPHGHNDDNGLPQRPSDDGRRNSATSTQKSASEAAQEQDDQFDDDDDELDDKDFGFDDDADSDDDADNTDESDDTDAGNGGGGSDSDDDDESDDNGADEGGTEDADTDAESEDGGSGNGTSVDDESEDGAGNGSGDDSDSGDGDSDDADDQGSAGSGVGEDVVNQDAPSVEDLKELAKRHQESVKADSDVVKEVQDRLSQITDINSLTPTSSVFKRSQVRQSVSSAWASTSRKMAAHFQRIVRESDPGWNTHQASGRINVQRAMHADSLDEVWDRWDEGNQLANSLEVVVLVDRSSSMKYVEGHLSESVWALKKALDGIGASTTVFAFSSPSMYTGELGYDRLYAREDKVVGGKAIPVKASGGTNPIHALQETYKLLATSDKVMKLVIILTDGYWQDDVQDCNIIMERLNKGGVTTALAYMGWTDNKKASHSNQYIGHNAQVFDVVSGISGWASFANQVVKSVLTQKKGR